MLMFNLAKRATTSANSTVTGLAYQKTVTIQVADKEKDVELGTTKTKKQNKLKLYVNKFIGYKDFSWTV
ncbi:hypothetical protein YC2023_017455 [Brassica napus]|uniref:(rape) hypothetical protein n=1 Tax=Brassica napus TaxID=3708 RepID=A0A816K895_BRANA|nr:unnamed protein product [Brassica napus]